MTQLPLYSKGVYAIRPIDRGIDFDSKGGKSEGIIVISDVFPKLFCFY